MPIGKNAIKRVVNNGYSKVKSASPDMENSTVIANPSPEVIEKMIPTAKKSEAKKKTPSAEKKKTSTATKPAEKKKTAPATAKKSEQSSSLIGIGKELPIYLL